MNQTVLHPDMARLDESNHTSISHNNTVDVYSACIEIHGDDTVTLQPNIIDTQELVSRKPTFIATMVKPAKSQYQIDVDTQKRIQRLRAQAILHSHNAPKRNSVVKISNNNWRLFVGYTIAILAAVLLVIPFVNHVATALAAF